MNNVRTEIVDERKDAPFGDTTKPRPFDAPRYTVSIRSIICPFAAISSNSLSDKLSSSSSGSKTRSSYSHES